MKNNLDKLKEIYEEMQSDIDSESSSIIIEKINNYHSLLVHKDSEEYFKNLADNQIATLMGHYKGIQSYIMWLREYYSGTNELLMTVEECQLSLHRTLSNNGINDYKKFLIK